MYALRQRTDWDAHRSARSSAFPTTMFEADRLHKMTAPASAACVDGGVGDQKSSQISTWKTKSARSLAAKIRSVPKGAVWPASWTSRPTMPAPGANQRFS